MRAGVGHAEVERVDLATGPMAAAVARGADVEVDRAAVGRRVLRRMNAMSVGDSSVFQPTEYVPMVSSSGIAYCMIDVGSNAVKFVESSS